MPSGSSVAHSQHGPKVRSPPRVLDAVPDSAHPGGFNVETRIRSLSDTSDSTTQPAVPVHGNKYSKHLNTSLLPPPGELPKESERVQKSIPEVLGSSSVPEVLGYAQAKQQLKPVFRGSDRHATVSNVSQQCFDLLQKEAGWEKLRLDYNPQTETLIVRVPLFPHESLSRILGSLTRNRSSSELDSQTADEAGSTNIHLADGTTKSGDFVWLDPTLAQKEPDKSQLDASSSNSFPTVVLEVALSESVHKLSEDCARWILCSLGKVNLAMGIKIDAGPDNRHMKSISLRQWTLRRIVPHDTGSRCYDQQVREIKNPDEDAESEHGEATAYAFSLIMGDTVTTWETTSTLEKIFGEGIATPYPGSLVIKNWHMFRDESATAEEDEQVYAEIPYEALIHDIIVAFQRQLDDDKVGVKTTKRNYSELEIADVIAASQRNIAKATRHAKSQKTNADQEAGSSQRKRGGKKAGGSGQQRQEGQSSSSSRKGAAGRRPRV